MPWERPEEVARIPNRFPRLYSPRNLLNLTDTNHVWERALHLQALAQVLVSPF